MRLLLSLLAVVFGQSLANIGVPYTPSSPPQPQIVVSRERNAPNQVVLDHLKRDHLDRGLKLARDQVNGEVKKNRSRPRSIGKQFLRLFPFSSTFRLLFSADNDGLSACQALYSNYSTELERNAVLAEIGAEAARAINKFDY